VSGIKALKSNTNKKEPSFKGSVLDKVKDTINEKFYQGNYTNNIRNYPDGWRLSFSSHVWEIIRWSRTFRIVLYGLWNIDFYIFCRNRSGI
jgi:hypothetical protein